MFFHSLPTALHRYCSAPSDRVEKDRPTLRTRRLRCEPLEDRRLLDVGAQAVELFSVSPALFVENQGQWAEETVRYAHFGAGANVLHTSSGPVLMTSRSAILGKAQLGLGVLGPQVAHANAGSLQRQQKRHPLLAAKPRRLARGEPAQLIQLGRQEEFRLFRKLVR